jgi:hypothetical protein
LSIINYDGELTTAYKIKNTFRPTFIKYNHCVIAYILQPPAFLGLINIYNIS